MVGSRVGDRRALRDLSGVFGYEFAAGINKNGRFSPGYFLDPLTFAVVIVLPSKIRDKRDPGFKSSKGKLFDIGS